MPSADQPRNPQIRDLINKRHHLQNLFFDLLEERKIRLAAAEVVEEDTGITEKTRERRLAMIDAERIAIQDEMYGHRDELESIDDTLRAMGYRVEPFQQIIDRLYREDHPRPAPRW
ncbi:hypothetical protein HOY82DRAFT_539311 [Tuber indicum]|nr:hypothetical protein HOY82DRAFT_539311 [Tuber indicum]